jgi:hypothetical protein
MKLQMRRTNYNRRRQLCALSRFFCKRYIYPGSGVNQQLNCAFIAGGRSAVERGFTLRPTVAHERARFCAILGRSIAAFGFAP